MSKSLAPSVAYHSMHLRLATLAHNLAIAAFMCAAFNEGSDHRMRMMLDMPLDEDWRPGCRQPAPGWEGR